MPALRELRQAGAQVVAAAGIPYAYTLTIWGAGALCTGRFGLPSPAEVFGFVGGASVAYLGLALGLRRVTEMPRRGQAPLMLWENGAALPALAATYGLSQVMPGPGPSFFLVPLVATVLYLAGLSLLVSRFHLGPPTPGDRHPRRRRPDLADLADLATPELDGPSERSEVPRPDPGRRSPHHQDALG